MPMTQGIRICTENHYVIILLDVILGPFPQLPILSKSDIWAPPPVEYIKYSGNLCRGHTVTFQDMEFNCRVMNPGMRKMIVRSLISSKNGGRILM